MSDSLKVLVADDSIVYRKLLSDIINQRSDMELIGVAPHGGIALSKIELKKPDLVLLDVAMPEKDGLEILEIIKERNLPIDVIFISGLSKENATLSVKALELGALDLVPKPETDSSEESLKELTATLSPLLNLAKTRKFTRDAKSPKPKKAEPEKTQPVKPEFDKRDFGQKKAKISQSATAKNVNVGTRKAPPVRIVAIGVSTGGPNALTKVLPMLNSDLNVPILIVQHMPPAFTATLAERLNNLSELTVVEASEGMEITKGTVYIAPGGQHMITRKNKNDKIVIGLTNSPPVHNCRPAVDVLFRSVAMTYGESILSVILTGMGSDGAAGVATIRRKGGYCIIQDEESSVVWGMPGAVNEAGDADEILDLELIPGRITSIVKRTS